MSDVGDLLDELGQTEIPDLAADAFPDTLKVIRNTETTDSGGGYSSLADTIFDYESDVVPCVYEPFSGQKFDSAGKLISTEIYKITMPTHLSGERINLTSLDELEVQERGNEPLQTFRIVSIGNESGVVFEVICTKEN